MNQTIELITEVHRTHEINRSKVHKAFASLRQFINEHEARLKESISVIETNNTRQLEDYQIRLLDIQNSLDIQQDKFFEIVSKGEHIRLLQTEYGPVDYLNKIHKELRKLKVPTRTQYDIQGLEKLSQIKEDILQCGRVEQQINKSSAYENPWLEKKMADQKNSQWLDLSDEHLNDQDMKILAEKYHEITTLTTLSLQQNHIGLKGAKYLADALHDNKTLTVLSLSGNRFGPKGVRDLTNTLDANTSLTNVLVNGMNLCRNRRTCNINVN
ncbi:unnamed protein product [Rotaria sordida]|uniref:Uncharacterized protein n=1 Tax=Rotaria sordida TaxID=392033 RepID=A0A820AMA5_9BILA|nr:unnamed protein product [Rotaria sordida]